MPDRVGSRVRRFEFMGGVPEVLVPDNLKSGVKHPPYYDPELNPTYRDLAEHYGITILPARSRKPKDKAKVEGSVLIVERWILEADVKATDEEICAIITHVGELRCS